jgi:xylulose-5-phosphate/fructose-6-phosphate phosphoketolase
MNHCLRSNNYVNVIVADKQDHLQYLDMESAIQHCTKGIGIWSRFGTDAGYNPDLIMASCGDISTQESLAAVDLLLGYFPDLKIRFVNCVDLFKLIHPSDHPHGLTDKEWESLFTEDTPIIFNFHSYPWMVHRLTYKRPGSRNLHVRGYREKGNIDTPLELAIRNQTDRFSLAIDAIDRMPLLRKRGAWARQALLDQQITARNESFKMGMDPPAITQWTWQRDEWCKKATEKTSRNRW